MTMTQFPSVINVVNLNGENGVRFDGEQPNEQSGYNVSILKDINGDGIADLVIAAHDASSPSLQSNAGCIYVVFGHREPWTTPINLATINGTNGFKFYGEQAGVHMGSGYMNANIDINKDGFSDLIIGAEYANPLGRNSAGITYVVFGHSGTWTSPFDLNTLNGVNGFKVFGENPYDYSGGAASSAGDINGDGVEDLLIGAGGASPAGKVEAGSSYVIFGHSGTWITPIELSSLDGTNGFKLNGEVAGDTCGYFVNGVGDINNDGVSDFIVSATTASPNGKFQAGTAYVVFGHPNPWTSPINLSSLNNSINGFKIDGERAGDAIGYSFSPCDVNGDGISDVVIGAPYATPNGDINRVGAGIVYVIFGHSGSWITPLDLINLNETMGFKLYGELNVNGLGYDMGAESDVNKDGICDLIISAFGVGYVVFGRNDDWQSPIELSSLNGTNGFRIYGDSNFRSISGGGDVNGDGIYDLIVGDPGNGGPSFGSSYVIWGDISSEQLVSNQLNIGGGQTLSLNATYLNATDARYNASQLSFSIDNVQHGRFEMAINPGVAITQFDQPQVENNEIQFVHDGSQQAPSYSVAVYHPAFAYLPPQPASITFDPAPLFVKNQLTLSQGQTVMLTSDNLNATHTHTPASDLQCTVGNVQQGYFEAVGTPGIAVTSFLQSAITGSTLRFVHDGSPIAPSYTVTVSDGSVNTGPTSALIQFNSYPLIGNNQLAIKQGETVILTTSDLSATDLETPLGSLIFIPSAVQHGQFTQRSNASFLLSNFTQNQVIGGRVQFIHDGSSHTPSYEMSVNDGALMSAPQAAHIDFTSDESPVSNTGSIIAGAAVGGALGVAALIGVGSLYAKNKAKQTLEQAIESQGNDGAFRRNTFFPIVKEVYKQIKISGCVGQIDRNTAERFVRAIQTVIEKLQQQGVDLDLERMTHENKQRLFNEIVKHIRFYTNTTSILGCFRFFKAEVTPAQIEDKAHAIARGVADIINPPQAAVNQADRVDEIDLMRLN